VCDCLLAIDDQTVDFKNSLPLVLLDLHVLVFLSICLLVSKIVRNKVSLVLSIGPKQFLCSQSSSIAENVHDRWRGLCFLLPRGFAS
jgi:hypothetical protein